MNKAEKPPYDYNYTTFAPKYYTEKDGGEWIPWPAYHWHALDLPKLNERHPVQIIINGIQVHSLAFDSPALGFGKFLRWDCVNGFNQSPPLTTF